MANKLGLTIQETASLIDTLLYRMGEHWRRGRGISVPNFGKFKIKNIREYNGFIPSTRSRMMLPPNRVLVFKPYITFKEKPAENNE